METKQLFKGRLLTRTKVRNQILKVYNQCTTEDKYDWYAEANKFAESISTKDKIKVCGIIAALSPVKSWKANMKLAIDFWNTQDCGHMKLFKEKARQIYNLENPTVDNISEILKGNKIKSFFYNIYCPEAVTNITIDRHALSIALGYSLSEDELKGITENQYNFFRDCYIWTADYLGMRPNYLQSCTWVRWRLLKKNK